MQFVKEMMNYLSHMFLRPLWLCKQALLQDMKCEGIFFFFPFRIKFRMSNPIARWLFSETEG